MSDHPALLTRWALLLNSARDTTTPDPDPYGLDLLSRWAEPQRRYHTTDHLIAVLDRIDELLEHTEAPDPDAIRLAAWFHDAVYLPDRSTNEDRSARLAERALPEAGVPEARVAETARLVRLTTDHDPAEGDTNGEASATPTSRCWRAHPMPTARTRQRSARSTASSRTTPSAKAARTSSATSWACPTCSAPRSPTTAGIGGPPQHDHGAGAAGARVVIRRA